MAGFLPRARTDYIDWAVNYARGTAAIGERLGLSPDEIAAIQSASVAVRDAFTASEAARRAWEAALAEEKDRVDAASALFRRTARTVQHHPDTTDPDRVLLGLSVPRGGSPIAAPTITPFLSVTVDGPFTHTLDIRGALERRGKPRGCAAFEVFVAVTPPGRLAPGRPEAYRYLLTAGRSPLRVKRLPDETGHTAWYAARWTNRKGEPGPPSLPVPAVILGNPYSTRRAA